MRARKLVASLAACAVFAASAAPAFACWPASEQDVQQCKASCNKQAQSYENCKADCRTQFNNCTKGTHDQTRP